MAWLEARPKLLRVETMEKDDFRPANGRMVIRIKGSLAQQEAERVSERVMRAFLQRVSNGQLTGGSRYRPFGFKRKRGTAYMWPAPKEQKIIAGWYRSIAATKPKSLAYLMDKTLASAGVFSCWWWPRSRAELVALGLTTVLSWGRWPVTGGVVLSL